MDDMMKGMPNLDQDPFADIVAQAKSSRQPQPQAAPQMMGMQKGGMMEEMPKNQLNPGENEGTTQYLLGAMQSLQKYVTENDDAGEIQAARSIMALLSQLIVKDQKKQSSKLGQ